MMHNVNIILHVVAGTIALLIGLLAIFFKDRTASHKRFGRYFLYLLSVVVTTGFLGWLFFRSNSFLLMLTILSGYVGYAGFRAIRLRENRGSLVDAAISIIALATGIAYVLWLKQNNGDWSPSVVYPTLFALLMVTVYDLVKRFWLHTSLRSWWIYEHIYKMISAFSAILSAFVGTVLPDFKPYSQIGPSTICMMLIIFFIWQQARRRYRAKRIAIHSPLVQPEMN